MGRIRTVKPELLTHEDLFILEKETGLPIRLAFVGLFTVCDRDGKFKWQPNRIKLAVLPYDELDFSRVLDALVTRGFIRMYSVNNEIFGVIPTWNKHQVINNRESASEIPDPEENSYISTASTREARVVVASATPLVRAPVEGKGREGKGKGREGDKGAAPPIGETSVIFSYWQKVMNHPQSKLDDKREKLMKARLKDGYTVEQICKAIDGCKISSYHRGENANGTVYDSLDLICRDGAKLDSFIGHAERGPIKQAGSTQNDKFHFSNLDRSGDQAAMDLSMKRNNIIVEDGDIPF
jgi:hypothetical protein